MKSFFLAALALISIVCEAQKRDRRDGVYSAYLYAAESPKGLIDFRIDSSLSVYEDNFIKIKWRYGVSQFEFDLTNKSDQTIKLLWDDAVFISLDNETNRVFHRGVKIIDRESPQSPSSIYKNSTLADLVAPSSYTRYVSGQYGGWRSSPLIPVTQGAFANKIDYLKEFIGKTMRVVLPLKINDETSEYVFSFRTEFIENRKR
jgi:hypothetical protein